MATNEKIKLDITSAFDPGGFTRADNAVKGLGRTMKGQGEAVNKVVTAFGDANTSVGKFAKSAQNLMGAFAGGGVWGLAAAGVALVVTKLVEARSAAKKLAEEQKAAMEKFFAENLIKRTENGLSMLKSRHAEIADEIERGAKAAEKIAKAYEGLAKSEVSASNAETDRIIALLEGGRQTALSGEQDPVKRKAIELDYERQILEIKKEAAKFERDQKASMASEKVIDAEGALSAQQQKLSALRARAQELEDWMSTRTGASQTRLYGQAKAELESTRGKISDAEIGVREKQIGATSARNELDAAIKENQAAVTRAAITENALAEKQLEFQKAQEDYQKSLDKRVTVERQIARQEGKIADIKQAESLREERRKEWSAKSDQAKALGAGGWRRMNESNDAAAEQRGKDTMSEARWVEGAKKRMSTGAKLSGKDLKRVFGFDEWKELQGANPFDPAKAAEKQIKSMEDNLKELQKLNTNLENALRVN
jgi:hypothetical protein